MTPLGYGQFNIGNGRMEGAHRVAWTLTFGPIPEGLQVCHACDVPACCNPDHLMLGTMVANMLDAERKGRRPKVSPLRRLTDEQAEEIRRAIAAGEPSKRVAKRYNVGQMTVLAVAHGKIYKLKSAMYKRGEQYLPN